MAKAYTTANIDSDLHEQITKEAKENDISFSTQIRRYKEIAEEVLKYERRMN